MNFLTTIFGDILTESVGWFLIHSLWLGSMVAIIIMIVMKLLKNRSAQLRYYISYSALVLVLLSSSFALYKAYDFARDKEEIREILLSNPSYISDQLINNLKSDTQAEKSEYQKVKFRWIKLRSGLYPYFPWIVGLWIIGLAFYFLKISGGLIYLYRIRRCERYALEPFWKKKVIQFCTSLQIKRKIGIFMSTNIKTPITLGFFKPLVLLPFSLLTGMPPEMIEAIILHELAHIKRNDFLMNIVQTLIETLFFYHPGIWYLSSQIRRERELACDDIALNLTTDKLTYAKALSVAQENIIQNGNLALAFAGNKNSLIKRIQRLNTNITMKTNLIEKVTAGFLILAAFLFFSFMIDGNNYKIKEKETKDYSNIDSTNAHKKIVIIQHQDTLSGESKKVVRHISTNSKDELDSLLIALGSCDDPTGEVDKVIEIVLTEPELIHYEEIMKSVQEALREIDMEKVALDMEIAKLNMDSIRHAMIIECKDLDVLKGLDSIGRNVQMSVNDAMIVAMEELHQLNLDSILKQACLEANRAIADLDMEYIIADALEDAQRSLEEEHIRIIKIQKELDELNSEKSYDQKYEDLKAKEKDLKEQLRELEEELKEVKQKQKEEAQASE